MITLTMRFSTTTLLIGLSVRGLKLRVERSKNSFSGGIGELIFKHTSIHRLTLRSLIFGRQQVPDLQPDEIASLSVSLSMA